MRLKALVVASLTFGVFWYLSSYFASYAVGYEIPFIGFVGVHPFAEFSTPLIVIGGLFAVVVYFMMSRKRASD